jgi:hypothetical protein
LGCGLDSRIQRLPAERAEITLCGARLCATHQPQHIARQNPRDYAVVLRLVGTAAALRVIMRIAGGRILRIDLRGARR